MKNKILMLIALCMSANSSAKFMGSKTPVEQLAEFHVMEEAHKNDWLTFMEKKSAGKITILKKQKKDWVSFANEQDKVLAALTEFSEPTKNAYFNNKLRAAVALHKKHVAAWEAWARSKNDEARALAEKHSTQVADFEKKLS